jgi:hypothetical protein
MRILFFTSLLLAINHVAPSQDVYKSYTLFDEAGQIMEKPISISFLSRDGKVHDKHIQSLTVLKLDSIFYKDNDPDKQQMVGTPIDLNFNHVGDSLIVKPFSPEYYAIFVAYHTLRAIEYFDSIFAGHLDFTNQSEYSNIEVFLGRYSQSNPRQYVFTPGSRPSPTIVYHEIGHRAFWQLQDTLKIGGPGDILHMGLLEYFSATQANSPVILKGLVPTPLQRDISKSTRYPDGVINYPDFWAMYHEAYKDSFAVAPAYKLLYDVNVRMMARWDSIYKAHDVAKNVIEAHRGGMVITHPLWQLRLRLGQAKCDDLVKTAMLMLPSILKKRANYLEKPETAPQGSAQWYDFVYALNAADDKLFTGAHRTLITDVFKDAGFDVNLIRTN